MAAIFGGINLQQLAIPIGGGLAGALAGYVAKDTICGTLDRNPWLAPLLGSLAGAGAGFLVLRLIGRG